MNHYCNSCNQRHDCPLLQFAESLREKICLIYQFSDKDCQFSISPDVEDMQSISVEEIMKLAFDVKTDDCYADYLRAVLLKAKKTAEGVGSSLSNIEFTIHENGCIAPFGLGSFHPYCANFMK